jgi:Family of unknown function (DUF5335)
LPLAGITVSEDSLSGTSGEIIVGKSANEHWSHTITRPNYVAIKQTEAGIDEALEIKSEDGTTTLVCFRSAMPAERVDGL